MQEVTEENINTLRNTLSMCQNTGGGTEMFRALYKTLSRLPTSYTYDSWIVCLTDGQSGDECRKEFQQDFCVSPSNLHMMIIGISLRAEY